MVLNAHPGNIPRKKYVAFTHHQPPIDYPAVYELEVSSAFLFKAGKFVQDDAHDQPDTRGGFTR